MDKDNKNKVIKVRSEFANISITGAGTHKSHKDYDRKKNKDIIKEELHDKVWALNSYFFYNINWLCDDVCYIITVENLKEKRR